MALILEGNWRQRETFAARRKLSHDGAALFFAHQAPAPDFVKRARAAHAHVALRIHDADLYAGRFHALADSALLTLDEGCRPSKPQIHCPMPTSLSRSMPVSMPRPLSKYTTSSVATLPEAPFA